MTTTISGTTITFTDGSTWTGANGALIVDNNSATTATAYNVGYLAFANTVFAAGGGFTAAGNFAWGLSRSNWTSPFFDATGNPAAVYVNTVNAVDAYLGSQSFYVAGSSQGGGVGVVAGTWRARGQALNTGLYQYLGNFVLLERVA